MQPCNSCGKNVIPGSTFCPYCGTSNPTRRKQEDQVVAGAKPIIRKDGGAQAQRKTPASSTSEKRTVNRMVPPTGLRAKPTASLAKNQGSSAPVESSDSKSSDSATPEASKPRRKLSPDEYRPTVRRMVPPDVGRKRPEAPVITDPRKTESTSKKAEPPQERQEHTVDDASVVSETSASESQASQPMTDGVIDARDIQSVNALADKTLAVQITPEMLDELDRRSNAPRTPAHEPLEEAPRAQTLRGTPVAKPKTVSETADEFSSVTQEPVSPDMAATAAIKVSPQMLKNIEADMASRHRSKVDRTATDPGVDPTETGPYSPPTDLKASQQDALPSTPSPNEISTSLIRGLPHAPGAADDVIASVGTPQSGAWGALRYSRNSGRALSAMKAAQRTLERRTVVLNQQRNSIALEVGRLALHDIETATLVPQFTQQLEKHRVDVAALEHSVAESQVKLEAFHAQFETDHGVLVQSMDSAVEQRDVMRVELGSLETKLQESQKALLAHQTTIKDAESQIASLQANQSESAQSAIRQLQQNTQKANQECLALKQDIEQCVSDRKRLTVQLTAIENTANTAIQAVERAKTEHQRHFRALEADAIAAQKALEKKQAELEVPCRELGFALLSEERGQAKYTQKAQWMAEAESVGLADDELRGQWDAVEKAIDFNTVRRGRRVLAVAVGAPLLIAVLLWLFLPFTDPLGLYGSKAAADVPESAQNQGTSSEEIAQRYLPEGLYVYAGISLDGAMNSSLVKTLAGAEFEEVQTGLAGMGVTFKSAVVGYKGNIEKPNIVVLQSESTQKDGDAVWQKQVQRELRHLNQVHKQDSDGVTAFYSDDSDLESWVKDKDGQSFTSESHIKSVLEHIDLNATLWTISTVDGMDMGLKQFLGIKQLPEEMMGLWEGLSGAGVSVHVADSVFGKLVVRWESSAQADAAFAELKKLKEQAQGMLDAAPEALRPVAETLLKEVEMGTAGAFVVVKLNLKLETIQTIIKFIN